MKSILHQQTPRHAPSITLSVLTACLISIMMLFCLPGKAHAQGSNYSNWAEYGKAAEVGTNGSEKDISIQNTTYTVKTAQGLAWIAFVTNQANTTTANYPTAQGFPGYTIELANDIDLADESIPVTNKSWIPIGKGFKFSRPELPFKGTFNGKGHQVTGLSITDNTLESAGLFGYLYEANIQNSGVILAQITLTRESEGSRYIGGITGFIYKSNIENCYTGGTGKIQITSKANGLMNVGGIAGSSSNSCQIKYCYSTVDISITGFLLSESGGIIGTGSGCTVSYCYTTSKLAGGKVAGIGINTGINNCLVASPTIKASEGQDYSRVGSYSSPTSYASTSTQIYQGDRLITLPGHLKHGNNCHSLTPLTFLEGGWDISGDNLPRLKMKNEDGTFSDWPIGSQPAENLVKTDFIPAPYGWAEIENADISITDSPDLDIWLENGTIYHVKTAFGLNWIRYIVQRNLPRSYDNNPLIPEEEGFEDCTVVLDNDIDLDIGECMANKDWLSIGYDGGEGLRNGVWVSSRDFKGVFDGNFHTVSNMTITKLANENDKTSEIYFGLFGYTRNGQIKNLNVEGSITLNASSYPYEKTTTIYAGGIAGGLGINSSIINSTSSVRIEIDDKDHFYYAGGIAGFSGQFIDAARLGRTKLENVCSMGDVIVASKNPNVGGITGVNRGDVLNCYSTAHVKADGGTQSGNATYAGGIVGYSYSNNALIKNCFATGSVLATNNSGQVASAGGICGHNNSKVESCLALNRSKTGETAAITGKSAGRVAGYSAGTIGMETCYASTLITLQEGSNAIAVPTEDKETTKKNGADVYAENAATKIVAWAGENKAFTMLGSTTDGFLPQLRAKTGDNAYSQDLLRYQPELKTVDHLVFTSNLPLTLPGGASAIILSNTDGIWTQKNGNDGEVLPFNGTIVNAPGEKSDNALLIASAKSEPVLILKNVTIASVAGIPLCNNEESEATVRFEGTNSLSSKTYPSLSNQGTLQTILAENGSCNLISGVDAIENTGTLEGGWLEWEFETAITMDNQAIKWEEVDSQTSGISGSGNLSKNDKAFGVLLPSEKSFTLTVAEKPWKAFAGDQKLIQVFTTGNDIATTYTQASELKNFIISGNEAYNEIHKNNRITIETNGIFTIEADDVSVFSLTIQPGGQMVSDKPLKVFHDFTTPRTFNNQWSTFAAPVPVTATVADDSKRLYTANGYLTAGTDAQKWSSLSGTEGETATDFTAATPYLIAAENEGTEATFKATGVTIPAAQEMKLGEALANGVFLFVANSSLQNQKLSGIYMLNAEKNCFELKEGETIVGPMQAFIVANAVTQAAIKSLTLTAGNMPTANEQAIVNKDARIYGADGQLFISLDSPAEVTVFNTTGQLIRRIQAIAGDTQTTLPSGIYLIRCHTITYKIKL